MTDYDRRRFRPIMVKAQVRSCLMRVAGKKQTEYGRAVSQGDIIAEMLQQNYPLEWEETCHQ